MTELSDVEFDKQVRVYARAAMRRHEDYETAVRAVIPACGDWFDPVMDQVNEWSADDQADY